MCIREQFFWQMLLGWGGAFFVMHKTFRLKRERAEIAQMHLNWKVPEQQLHCAEMIYCKSSE